MFASRYFNPRYWAARYWPKIGGESVATEDCYETVQGTIKELAVSVGSRIYINNSFASNIDDSAIPVNSYIEQSNSLKSNINTNNSFNGKIEDSVTSVKSNLCH